MRFVNVVLNPFAVAAVLIILLISWVVWGSLNFPEALWAPGDLSRFHVGEVSGCSDCHQPFKGAAPEKCVNCHDDKGFVNLNKNAVAEIHQDFIQAGKDCTACHTEHRGTLAQITIGALKNPHGDFVFSATGARACTSCHELDKNFQTEGKVLNNVITKLLMVRGEGKHRPGKMVNCSTCHSNEENHEN